MEGFTPARLLSFSTLFFSPQQDTVSLSVFFLNLLSPYTTSALPRPSSACTPLMSSSNCQGNSWPGVYVVEGKEG